jgi:hypothetical protein
MFDLYDVVLSLRLVFRMFGKPGSQYDFATSDIPRLKEKAKELEESQKGMKKKVNPKVINMIDRWAAQVSL